MGWRIFIKGVSLLLTARHIVPNFHYFCAKINLNDCNAICVFGMISLCAWITPGTEMRDTRIGVTCAATDSPTSIST